MPPELFGEDPGGTREAIMSATYRALRKHGYADLTIQHIGDEFAKSKSLLYHHYESKDALLVDILEFMLDRLAEDVPGEECADPREHLRAVLDHAVPPGGGEERAEFTRAIVELRAQAAHDEAYREQFTRSDRFFHRRLAAIVERGVEQGVFREVEPERAAAQLLTAVNGAMLQRATTDDPSLVEETRAELDAYVESRLLADGVDRSGDGDGS